MYINYRSRCHTSVPSPSLLLMYVPILFGKMKNSHWLQEDFSHLFDIVAY